MSGESNKILQLFSEDLKVVNVGLEDFANNLQQRDDVDCVHVEWSPPAGGDEELLDLLDKLQ